MPLSLQHLHLPQSVTATHTNGALGRQGKEGGPRSVGTYFFGVGHPSVNQGFQKGGSGCQGVTTTGVRTLGHATPSGAPQKGTGRPTGPPDRSVRRSRPVLTGDAMVQHVQRTAILFHVYTLVCTHVPLVHAARSMHPLSAAFAWGVCVCEWRRAHAVVTCAGCALGPEGGLVAPDLDGDFGGRFSAHCIGGQGVFLNSQACLGGRGLV